MISLAQVRTQIQGYIQSMMIYPLFACIFIPIRYHGTTVAAML